jgi:RNA polymerase sigma factor (TIGR02999 family)
MEASSEPSGQGVAAAVDSGVALSEYLQTCSPAQRESITAAFPAIYAELHLLAQRYLRRERPDHTLQATALVNEAYLRLQDGARPAWSDRAHFFRIAARCMRHILVNHAERHGAAKRGGGRRPAALEESLVVADGAANENLPLLHEALCRLSELYPQKAAVVELRYFGGCTIDQTAEALGISTATVEREWRFARAWLLDALSGDERSRTG